MKYHLRAVSVNLSFKSRIIQDMKFISWNVNGLRACCGKGFEDSFLALNADFFCLQETKLQEEEGLLGDCDILAP